jgi:hypothetical protein
MVRQFLTSIALLGAAANAWSVTNTGFTSELDGIYYYSPPTAVGSIELPSSLASSITPGSYAAISVVSTDDAAFQASSLAESFSVDDVWTEAFAETVYVQYTGTGALSTGYSSSLIAGNGTSFPSGPYFVSSTGSLYEVHRLYSDLQGAFTEAVTTSANGSFSVLPAGVPGQSLAIAVPSRLYFTKTEAKPLAGVRLGVKDIYDVAGLKTSNGNRAWYHLYPAAEVTAPCIQVLVDAGAVIVGKLKTSQFANGESATADWVDYHSPFNPRGDGYQQPSSSSSGSGAAAGAYEWLDLTTGSDTGGSIRGPSGAQGLFGNRPSHNLVTLDHVMPLAPQLDTPGFLTRDPVIWAEASKVMYGDNITFISSYPSEILTIGYPTEVETPGDQLLVDFLATLTEFLSANTSTPFNISASWAETGTVDIPLAQFLNTTYAVIIAKAQTELVRDPFYADYAAANDGRLPFVNPVPLYRWGYGDNATETIEEAVANKTTFMDWFNSEILVATPETCSDKILLYVGSNADTSYRNRYLPPPAVPFGFSTGRLSVFSEAPDFVIPLGQAPYNSTVTGHEEFLPVTVDIMAAKGCDGMLFNLINELVSTGVVKPPVAGRTPVEGGQILYRRDLQ